MINKLIAPPILLPHGCNRTRHEHDRPRRGDNDYGEAHKLGQIVWSLSIGVSITKEVASARPLECHGFHRISFFHNSVWHFHFDNIDSYFDGCAARKSNRIVTFPRAPRSTAATFR